MRIATEPIGSIPRPLELIAAIAEHGHGHPDLEPLYEQASRDTIARLEARVRGTALAEARLAATKPR